MVNYKRIGDSKLFVQVGVDQPASAFLLAVDNPSITTISLQDSWGKGFYCFFRHLPPDAVAFGLAIFQKFAPDSSGPGPTTTTAPQVGWVFQEEDDPQVLRDFLSIRAAAIPGGKFALVEEFKPTFANAFFEALVDCTLELNAIDGELVLRGEPDRISLRIVAEDILQVSLPKITVELSNAIPGQLSFECELDSSELTGLNVAIHYHYPIPPLSVGRVRSDRFDFIKGSNGNVPFSGFLDLLRRTDPNRTFFYFRKLASPSQRIVFQSTLVTRRNTRVLLAPAPLGSEHAGRLVLSYLVSRKTTPPSQEYLTPSGDYELIVDGPDPESGHYLLPGIMGTESFRFRAGKSTDPQPTGDFLHFVPGGPAFFEDAPLQGPSPAADDGQPRLTNIATTSYALVRPNLTAQTTYGALPEEQPLYAPTPDGIFPSADLDLVTFPRIHPSAGEAPKGVPLLPLGGMRAASDDGEAHGRAFKLESAFVNLDRRDQVKQLPSASGNGGTPHPSPNAEQRTVTTPQGMLAELVGSDWNTVTMARASLERKPAKPVDQQLTITPSKELADALQHNRLFLVAPQQSGLPGVGTLLDGGKISLANWEFTLFPSTSAPAAQGPPPEFSAHPILIFKFNNRPLEALFQDTSQWTRPDAFVPAGWLEALQKYLRDVWAVQVHQRFADPETRGLYEEIYTALTAPEWSGILALNCGLDANSFPDGARCLVGGIDLKKLRAHHMGIRVNDIGTGPNSGGVEIKKSSLFGLIPYEDNTEFGSETGGDARFKVRKLNIHFSNSQLRDFQCRILLKAMTLFDQQVDPNKPPIEIEGRYENHGGNDVYTFLSENVVDFQFDGFLLRRLQVRKIQFATVDAGGGGDTIRSRFAIWGHLEFAPLDTGLDLFSFKELHFADLGIDMTSLLKSGEPTQSELHFSPGGLRFDLAPSKKVLESFLSRFPLKLTGFSFSLGGISQIRLPELGFFSIALPGLSSLAVCRYALRFEVDLGSLGSLSGPQKGFRAEILIGWDGKGVAFGIKLPEWTGGKKEIGIEGVLKLLIDDFALKQESYRDPQTGLDRNAYALKLVGCRLQALGREFPSEAKIDAYLFADPARLEPGKVGWYLGYLPEGGGGGFFHLDYLGFGQRVSPREPHALSSFKQIIDFLKTADHATATGEDYLKLERLQTGSPIRYNPEADWLIATQFRLAEKLDVGLVVNDPLFYMLFLGVLPNDHGYAFSFEIAYRKISDELGVWAVDVGLPEGWRQIEMGAVSITLPNVSIAVYSNGDWKLDVGFPRDLDFSRCFQVQALPFLGAGGFYLAKLSGSTSDLLPGFPGRVYQIGIALRLGLGKEFRKGILRAGLSITFYGILEGALGLTPSSLASEPGRTQPTAWVVMGRFGVIGEIFGVVDFGIVKAAVSIRLWAGVGVLLHYRKPTVLWVEAGVEVQVVLVLARFRIFGHTIEIKISFGFHAEVRFTWQLGDGQSSALEAGIPARRDDQVPVLSWKTGYLHFDAPQPLPLYFVPEMALFHNRTAARDELHMVALLAVEPGHFSELAGALAAWTLYRNKVLNGELNEGDPRSELLRTTVTAAELDELNRSLHRPVTLARTRPVADMSGKPLQVEQPLPLDYDRLCTFLAENFHASIEPLPNAEPGKTLDARFFPVFRDLEVTGAGGTGTRVDLRLWEAGDAQDEAYQDYISTYLQDLYVNFRPETGGPGLLATDPIRLHQVLFQDFFDCLIKGAVDQLWQALKERENTGTPQTTVGELLQANASFDRLSAMLTRFFKHGLRLPVRVDSRETEPLFLRTGQQFSLEAAADDGTFQLRLQSRPATPGHPLPPLPFSISPGMQPLSLEAGAISRLKGWSARIRQELPATTRILRRSYLGDPRGQTYAFERQLAWREAGSADWTRRIWWFPDALRLAAGEPQPPQVRLFTSPAGKDHTREQPHELTVSWNWATRIELRLRKVPRPGGAGPVPGVYLLLGADESNRRLLDRLLGENPDGTLRYRDLIDSATLRLLYQEKAANPDHVIGLRLVSDPVPPSDVILLKTNLSTVTQPRSFSPLADTDPAAVVSAALQGENVGALQLVQECSLVNSGGYYVMYPGGLPDTAFQAADGTDSGAPVTLLIEFRLAGPMREPVYPFVNSVVVSREAGAPEPDDLFYAEAQDANHQVYGIVVEPGCVPFCVDRINPERRFRSLTDGGLASRDQVRERIGTLHAANPDDLADPDVAKRWAEAEADRVEVEKLFNLLEYGLVPDGKFRATEDGLPMGPRPRWSDDPNAIDPIEPPLPPEQAEQLDWRYRQSLPVYRFLDMGQTGNPPKPVVNGNPYACVGETVTLRFDFRDVFGNGLDADLKSAPIPLKYSDWLHGLDEWPSLQVRYDFETPNRLKVIFQFDRSAYRLKKNPTPDDAAAWGKRCQEVRERCARIHMQLDRADVDARLRSTLTPGQTYPELKAHLLSLLADLLAFLPEHPDPKQPLQPPPTPGVPDVLEKVLWLPLTSDLEQAAVFPLKLEWEITRRAELVEPELLQPDPMKPGATRPRSARSQRVAGEVLSVLGMTSDQTGETLTLEVLADHFEGCFPDAPGGESRYRLASGLDSEGRPGLWAVARPVVKVSRPVTEANRILYYAPRPLRNDLWSEEVPVPIPSAPDRKVHFTDIDLDVWMRGFLGAVERVLEPESAAHASRLSRASFASLMRSKLRLARNLRFLVEPLVADQSFRDPERQLAEARELFKQRVMLSLNNAYDIDTIVQVPVQVAKIPGFLDRTVPRLYGKMETAGDLVPLKGEFQLSPAKVVLGTADDRSELTFAFDWKNPAVPSASTLDFVYRITHIEHDIEDPGGPTGGDTDRYLRSSWLALAKAEVVDWMKETVVPVALRQYPTPPTLVEHGSALGRQPGDTPPAESGDHAARVEYARKWHYRFRYDLHPVEQDTVETSVTYNTPESGRPQLFALAEPWEYELARFQLAYPGLLSGLAELPQETPAARDALVTFADLVSKLAVASDQLRAGVSAEAAGGEQRTDLYDVRELQLGTQSRRVEVEFQGVAEPVARYLALTPLEVVPSSPPKITGDFRKLQVEYSWSGNPASDLYRRELVLGQLDVLSAARPAGQLDGLKAENAWSGIRLIRNRDLLKGLEEKLGLPAGKSPAINEKFIYQTPRVQFGMPLTPLLDPERSGTADGATTPRYVIRLALVGSSEPLKRPLSEHLSVFFKKLFEKSSGPVRLKIDCRYSFPVLPSETEQAERLRAFVPVKYCAPFSFQPGQDDDPSKTDGFCYRLATALRNWKTAEHPADEGDLNLDMTVFASLNESGNVPLLRLRSVRVAMQEIDFTKV